MKKKYICLTMSQRTAIDLDFLYFMVRLAALLLLTLFIGFMAKAGPVGTFSELDSLALPDEEFPNAIRISRAEMDAMMVGNDPYGILNYLSLKTGLTFRSTGDFGAEDWFTVRGFGRDNSRLTLVLVDGRPVNVTGNHTVEFGDIPMGLIEEILIYPGPVPAEYGGFQFVVDIRTLHNKEMVDASVSLGSLNTYWLNTSISGEGRFYYVANMDVNLSEGQTGQQLLGVLDHYTYDDRFDRAVLPSLKLGYELSRDVDISAHFGILDVKKTFGAGLHHGLEQSRIRTGRSYALNVQPGRTSDLDYRISLYLVNEDEFLNTEFPEDTTYNVGWGNHDRQKYGLNAYYRHQLIPGRFWIKAGGETHWSSGSQDNEDYIYLQFADEQHFYGAFLQAGLRPWEGAMLQLGGRVDGQSYLDDAYFSPSFSLSQNFLENRLQLYGSYGVSSRWLPLYKVNSFNRPPRPLGPPFLAGNINLPEADPAMERMRGVDAGLRVVLVENVLTARLNYYHLANEGTAGAPLFEIRPALEDNQLPPGIEAALVAYDRNLPGREINEGLELHLDFQLNSKLRMFLNLSHTLYSETEVHDDIVLYQGPLGGPDAQEFLNQSAGQFVIPYAGRTVIPGAYDWLANLVASYAFDSGAILNLTMRYRSESVDPLMKFNLDPQVDAMDSFLLVDAGLRMPLATRDSFRLTATGRISNLFNSQYSTFVHYPMAGRFVSIGLNVTL